MKNDYFFGGEGGGLEGGICVERNDPSKMWRAGPTEQEILETPEIYMKFVCLAKWSPGPWLALEVLQDFS